MPETTVRRRAPRGQGSALRGEVLRAAMDLLAETGDEESVSLRAVAKRVGVSAPAIYLHFADKQALLDAVCEAVFEALHVRMLAASANAADAFDVLRRQGIAYVEFALENPEHYRIIMMGKAVALTAEDAAVHVAGGSFNYLVASVQECVDQGVFEGEPVHLAMRLWAATHGLAALLISKPSFPWPPLEELIASTVVMAGLGLVLEARVTDLLGAGMLPELVERVDRARPAAPLRPTKKRT